jgi:hypothetical protein
MRTREDRIRILQLGLLTAILGLHLVSRLCALLTTPLDQMHFYPESYLVSLSLLSGNGFNYLVPGFDHTGTPSPRPAVPAQPGSGGAGAVMDFVAGTGRDGVSQGEFASFLASGVRAAPTEWERTRVLDIYVAAGLWKLFGISWPTLLAFYALVSTAACLLVFFITQRVAGSAWAGLLGALAFMASPLERVAGAWSIRDANPLWFACLGIFLLLHCAEPRASRLGSFLGWFAIGAGNAVGIGWRTDALLLFPFAVVSLMAILVARRRPARQLVLAVAACLAGLVATKSLVSWLGPTAGGQGGGVGFHVAWYGEEARSNLLGTENAFQAVKDDEVTLYQANYFRLRRHGDREPTRGFYDPRYLATVRALYLEMLRYDAYPWWRRFPAFLASVTRVDQPVEAGPPIWVVPKRPARPHADCVAWHQLLYERALHWPVGWLPHLFVVGILLGVLVEGRRVATLLIAAYFVYYAAALLMVLPESKHWPPLLLPLHVLAASGVWLALTTPWTRLRPDGAAAWRLLRGPLAGIAGVALCWACIGLVAHSISRAQRGRLIDSITRLVASGQELPQDPAKRRFFAVAIPPEPEAPPAGYLFEVRGARQPATLFCAQVREGAAIDRDSYYYYTRHGLAPGRNSYFFVNPVSGRGVGDPRSYTLYVRVRGSEIVSVRRLDLSGWRIGLPLSLAFRARDDQPGASLMDDRTPVTESLRSLAELEAVVGYFPAGLTTSATHQTVPEVPEPSR